MDSAKVSDIVAEQKTIHVVTKNANVKEVLETLYKYNIISVPVIDLDQKCLGLVDVLDVLTFLLKVTTEPLQSRISPPSTSIKEDDMEMLLDRSFNFNLSSVDEALLVNLSRRNPFLPCTLGAPLRAVLDVFSRGVHRVPVVKADEPHTIVNILTQSDVNSFLAADPEKILGDKAGKTMEELGLVQGEDKVVAVPDDFKAIDAFFRMHEEHLSDVAIVNERGALQGCLSATDLKEIKEFAFRVLLLPVMAFVRQMHAARDRPRGYLVHVNKDATLEAVVRRLAAERVHRVFIVDDDLRPIGVVSLTDVARVLLH